MNKKQSDQLSCKIEQSVKKIGINKLMRKRLNDGEGTFHGDAIPRDLELCVHTLPPTVGAVSNLRTNTEKN